MDDDDNPEWSEANTRPLDHASKLKVVRARLTLSQDRLATLLNIPVGSLRNWEQRRTAPDGPARTLIDLLYRDPEGIRARIERPAA
jgi:putative transcriptional regulator